MTFEELQQTLNAAQAGGQIGTPVSLRLHLRLLDPRADLTVQIGACLELAESVLGRPVSRLMVHQNGGGHHISVLADHSGGQTATVTVSNTSAARAELHLLLVGNHGVIRLQGGEAFDEASIPGPYEPKRWQSLVEQSLQQRTSVDALA